jgi:uncharacterized protein YjiS (DUF1127 family)
MQSARDATFVAIGPRLLGAARLAGRLLGRDRLHRKSRHLADLPDHMLRDIGLTRDEASGRPRYWV